MPPMPGSAFWGWAGPLLVTLFGAFLRFNRLSLPKAVIFDETYYAGDAWAILQHGVEINHVKNANALLVQAARTSWPARRASWSRIRRSARS